MFRLTAVARKLSPFCLYVREAHAGTNRKINMKTIGKHYRALTPAQRGALVKRANKAPNPWGQKYAAFRKAQEKSYPKLSQNARNKKIAAAWKKERARLQKAASPKASKKPAAKKVKRAAKAAKAGRKTAKK